MTVRVHFVPASPDPVLVGAAQAATLHFAAVGISPETAWTFKEDLKEAGLAVSWTGTPGLFTISYAEGES